MSGNTLGTLFCVTSFGESHGPAIGCVVDGCPPGLALASADIQRDLDRRRPGTSRHVTQRRESDTGEVLSGVFAGRTTGSPIALLIRNEDQRSKDYAAIADTFRPGHADYAYWQKYGIRDHRGGGRRLDLGGDADFRTLHLSIAGLAAQLPGQFTDLRQGLRRHSLAEAGQAAGDVYRNPAAQRGITGAQQGCRLTAWGQL